MCVACALVLTEATRVKVTMLPPVNVPLVGVQPATPVLVTEITVAITGERPLQLRFRLQTLWLSSLKSEDPVMALH